MHAHEEVVNTPHTCTPHVQEWENFDPATGERGGGKDADELEAHRAKQVDAVVNAVRVFIYLLIYSSPRT